MRFFTSDTHFGHKKAPAWRNLESVDEMDALLIYKWNQRVGPDDEIFHLGDFAFERRTRVEDLLSKLNGRKFLVRGNHDPNSTMKATGWAAVYDMETIVIEGIGRAEMIHDPARASGNWPIVLHGHLHGTAGENLLHPFAPHLGVRYIDVGVDAGWDCAPASEPQIIGKLKGS